MTPMRRPFGGSGGFVGRKQRPPTASVPSVGIGGLVGAWARSGTVKPRRIGGSEVLLGCGLSAHRERECTEEKADDKGGDGPDIEGRGRAAEEDAADGAQVDRDAEDEDGPAEDLGKVDCHGRSEGVAVLGIAAGRRGVDRPSDTAYTLGGWGGSLAATPERGRRAARRRLHAARARVRDASSVTATMALGRKPLGENVVVRATRPR